MLGSGRRFTTSASANQYAQTHFIKDAPTTKTATRTRTGNKKMSHRTPAQNLAQIKHLVSAATRAIYFPLYTRRARASQCAQLYAARCGNYPAPPGADWRQRQQQRRRRRRRRQLPNRCSSNNYSPRHAIKLITAAAGVRCAAGPSHAHTATEAALSSFS